MPKLICTVLLLLCNARFIFPVNTNQVDIQYRCANGEISFRSDAPMEVIKGSSDKLKAIINVTNRTFAFSIQVNSFTGFNASLQKNHFNENYLESEKYPTATYTGKIIEDVDLTKNGVYDVRTKGILTMHGVEQERIIKSNITIENGKLALVSKFVVLLKDHNIRIPKVVHEKIASEVYISVNAVMK